MKKKTICLTVLFLILSLSNHYSESWAAPYYAGKTITIVVGSAPGGGFNNMARLIAEHFPKHIAGKPNIIISNMPGASGVIAANYVYNIAKPNGLIIGAIQGGSVLAQLAKSPGLKFDMAKFSWIGSPAVETCVLTLRSDLPYKNIEALMKAKGPLYLATSGAAGRNTQFTNILKAFVLPNIVTVAYPSNAEAFLAIERKEIDGMANAYTSMKPLLDRGLVRPLLRSDGPDEELKNIPVDEAYASDTRGKILMSIRTASDIIGRPYIAPPGTSPEAMKILREAFFKMTNDRAFLKDAMKVQMKITYFSAEDCLKKIKFLLNQPNDIAEEFIKYAQ